MDIRKFMKRKRDYEGGEETVDNENVSTSQQTGPGLFYTDRIEQWHNLLCFFRLLKKMTV